MDVVYVDEHDEVTGSGSIGDAISNGIRLRIARVFLSNKRGELLIQKRSANHPSLPNRWDQTAAGHVDKGENYKDAALRELSEEMGINDVALEDFKKYYTEERDETKLKKRFNKLFVGKYDGDVSIDHDEVSDYRWVEPKELAREMKENPNNFTEGFIRSFEVFQETL